MSTDVFIARTRELSALQAAFDDEEVRLVLIGGEAGLGKSRLVREFTSRLGAGPLVLTGRCLEFGNDGMAYAPFLPVMRKLLPDKDFPDRLRLFGAVLTVLEQIAEQQPLVLVLEDLHWADGSSLELLAFLAANLSVPNILLVGTHRAPFGTFKNLAAEWGRSPAVRRVEVAALTRHEVGRQLAALNGSEPDPVTVSRVYERSQGNPLFVEALSRSPEDTPTELQELLLAGLPELTVEARQTLDAASAQGTLVAHEPLAAVTGLPETVLHQALRSLVTKNLLIVADAGYVFRHALIRQAVYDALLPVERKRLHALLVKAFGDDEQHVAQLAAHAYAAGEFEVALGAAWRAAELARRSFAEAERTVLLQRVLELWSTVPEPAKLTGADRLAILDHAVDASIGAGSVPSGLRWSAEAVALEPTAARYFQQARLKNLAHAGGGDDLQRALELLSAEPPSLLRAEVLAELASLKVFAADPASAAKDASAALAIAEQLGDLSLASRAHAYLGLANANKPVVAGEHFAQARATADPRTLITVATWESAMRVALGEYAPAIDVIREGIGAAHQTYEYGKHGPILLVKWVQALNGLGRWEEALELAGETLGEPGLPALGRAALLIARAEALVARGNPGEAALAQASLTEAESLLGHEPWVRPYRIRLRTQQIRLSPARAAEIYAEALADGIEAHPHEAWALVAAAKPQQIPGLPVIGAVDEAHRAEALGQTRQQRQAVPVAQRGQLFGLTARELEVLGLVAEGKSNRQIAQALFISGNTAGVHVSRILSKLGAATRTEAARKFLDATSA